MTSPRLKGILSPSTQIAKNIQSSGLKFEGNSIRKPKILLKTPKIYGARLLGGGMRINLQNLNQNGQFKFK